MRHFLLALPVLLAACASPYESCVANATRDIRVLDGLIAQTRGNIARGYAIRNEEYFETEQQICGEVDGKPLYCDVPVALEREVPVAIDLKAEQAKLRSLLDTREQKARQAQAVARECRLRHPEG